MVFVKFCSRLLRSQIGGDIDTVFRGQMGDFRQHRCGGRTFSEAMLDVVELADDIAGRATGQRRYPAHPLELGTVA